MDLRERAAKIRLLLMDCDGVLTDGRLYFSAGGEELKVFHARDGEGIAQWNRSGFMSGIISGRNSPMVDLRGGQLGMTYILQGRRDKSAALAEILDATGIPAAETAFIGDDTPDIEVFGLVGLAVAVADAHESVKAAAHHITRFEGGCGAVREVIDLLIYAKNGV
jgi:3-deoxy-D-manno-octulosonate 8-phosphate phosphatase (KDO 8-P phosphatase)